MSRMRGCLDPKSSRRRHAGVSGLLSEAASTSPAAPYLEDRFGSVVSYAEAEAQVAVLAAFLKHAGIKRGDRVVLFLQNRVELVIALFATARIGAIFVVLNSMLRPRGLETILKQVDPALGIVDEATAATWAAVSSPQTTMIQIDGEPESEHSLSWESALAGDESAPAWDGCDLDPVALVFTSGSTGVPRGVTLSHDNITFVTAAIQDRLSYRASDIIGGFLPLAFDYGLYQIFLAAISGAKLYLGDSIQVGPRFPQILRSVGVSVLPGVPSIYAGLIALARRGLDLPALRAITNTGERLPLAHIEKLRELLPGLEVYVMYGLTECKRTSILLPSEFEAHPDTVGRALDGTEVYAVDEAGLTLAPGTVGELVVRGRHVALGYWRAPEETARRFRKRAPESAVELFTGDSGSVDEAGYIRFAVRSDDWIKHRGHRLSPIEIETEACQIDGVIEAALVQRESDDTLHLFVTSSPGLDEPKTILEALSRVLEPIKVPDRIHFMPQLPKSLNGKIDRSALLLHFNESATA